MKDKFNIVLTKYIYVMYGCSKDDILNLKIYDWKDLHVVSMKDSKVELRKILNYEIYKNKTIKMQLLIPYLNGNTLRLPVDQYNVKYFFAKDVNPVIYKLCI